jgi:dihydroorotate dehydrogenase (NAD+) catalytic subunit
MVWECRQAVKLPILGMGGITTVEDALEFIIAGADAVQVGTANFVQPFLWQDMLAGIDAYLDRHGFSNVGDLVGTLNMGGA